HPPVRPFHPEDMHRPGRSWSNGLRQLVLRLAEGAHPVVARPAGEQADGQFGSPVTGQREQAVAPMMHRPVSADEEEMPHTRREGAGERIVQVVERLGMDERMGYGLPLQPGLPGGPGVAAGDTVNDD